MNNHAESNRAKTAALLAKKDRENIIKHGVKILQHYRSGWSIVEIAAHTNESEATSIRIPAIGNFIDRVNSIVALIKANVEGLTATEISRKLNIELNIVSEELQWFKQSQILTQKGQVWIHKKYE